MTAPESLTIVDHLRGRARLTPYQHAAVFPAWRSRSGRIAYTHLTYTELNERSDALAHGLIAAGFTKGMRTAFMVKPSLEFFIISFALLKAGIIPVLVDPGIGLKYIKKCLRQAEAEAFIGIPRAHLGRVLFGWKGLGWQHLVTIGPHPFPGTLAYRSLLGRSSEAAPRPPLPALSLDEPAAILFTSGSTGAPKPVLASHRNFASQLRLMADTLGIMPGEYDLCTYAPFALFAPALGLTTVVPAMDFTRPALVDPERIKEAIDDFGISNMFGSPALIKRVAAYGRQKHWSFPTLTRVVSSGAPVSSAVIADFCPLLPEHARFYTAYGATEAMPVAFAESRELLGSARERHERGLGLCVGRPVAGSHVIKITEAPLSLLTPSDLLSPHQIGEIIVSGPHVTSGYYKLEAAERLAKVRDAAGTLFHRMGDLGYLDDAGLLWFCGRKSHRVQTRSGDLYTIPTEAVFNTHPWVARTALVGLGPSPDQTPCLCVEANHSLTPSERSLLLKELQLLAQAFAHTKMITRFLFHPKFPVDIRHNAKILREKLATWAAQDPASSADNQGDIGMSP